MAESKTRIWIARFYREQDKEPLRTAEIEAPTHAEAAKKAVRQMREDEERVDVNPA